jgi:hypothetical protein
MFNIKILREFKEEKIKIKKLEEVVLNHNKIIKIINSSSKKNLSQYKKNNKFLIGQFQNIFDLIKKND